jgi:hypothetical protein
VKASLAPNSSGFISECGADSCEFCEFDAAQQQLLLKHRPDAACAPPLHRSATTTSQVTCLPEHRICVPTTCTQAFRNSICHFSAGMFKPGPVASQFQLLQFIFRLGDLNFLHKTDSSIAFSPVSSFSRWVVPYRHGSHHYRGCCHLRRG